MRARKKRFAIRIAKLNFSVAPNLNQCDVLVEDIDTLVDAVDTLVVDTLVDDETELL